MRTFETYLLRAFRDEEGAHWSRHYINYATLKQMIRHFLERRRARRNRGDIEYSTDLMTSDKEYFCHETDPEDALQRLAAAEKEEFIVAINQELEKCTTFLHYRFQALKASLKSYEHEVLKIPELAAETLETFHFVVANICTLRQIILRFNSFRRTVDATLVDESDIPHARKLFALEPLADVEFAISLYQTFAEVKEELIQFAQQYYEFRLILVSSLQSVERAGGGNIVVRDRILSSGRQFLIKGSSKQGLMFEPSLLNQKGRHLKKEMRTLAKWRGGKMLTPKALNPSNVWPLVLNLISCFLFMMNNYIIEPSSAYYANALGTSDALSGLMIGSSAWFALISAVGYSFWTNTSYKRPIIFAGVLMIVGNFMYSNAYSYRNIYMCLLGRAICGLGAPRVINRRYVADATPFALRTRSSAAFALMTALGAAVGPGMAIVLEMFEFEFKLPLLRKQHFNGMTGPGYFMSLAWSIYTVLVILTFQEPKRLGLVELRLREEFPSTWDEDDNADDDDDASLDTEKLGKEGIQVEEPSLNSPTYCVKHMSRAAAIFMAVTFMKRVALESIVGSTSVITKNRYSWTITNVGTLQLASGLLVIPLSIISGWISQYFDDMYMAMWLNLITIFGMFVLVDVTDLIYHSNDTYNSHQLLSVGPIRYIAGSLIAFSGVEACESFVASLMSKAVPSKLAVGTFNSGLLLTLVGTSGRATGDMLITAMAFISIRNLLNLLIFPCIGLMLAGRMLVQRNRAILAP